MRIGLLTLPLETGYGSILQAYALKTVLTRQGHEVILIRRLVKKKAVQRLEYLKTKCQKIHIQKTCLRFLRQENLRRIPRNYTTHATIYRQMAATLFTGLL